ncbi:MAG: hypothetical protein HWD59_05680 [Coxiellaceae bacterium]|nr:MAG: hypothetical protein HWD59_05680 [Coxiellaceae bacterium]
MPEKTADGGVLSEYYAFEPREEFLANMERNPIRTEQATVGVHVRSESAHVFNTRLLRKENYFTLEFEPKIIEEIKNKAHREAAKAGKDYTKKYDAVYKAELEAYLKKMMQKSGGHVGQSIHCLLKISLIQDWCWD